MMRGVMGVQLVVHIHVHYIHVFCVSLVHWLIPMNTMNRHEEDETRDE